MDSNNNRMVPEELFLKIVRDAVKAPSGHNTQPWLFSRDGNTVIIKPDFSRALPVADPDHHELYISLGCAAENAVIAANHYGFRPELRITGKNKTAFIKIELTENSSDDSADLYHQIPFRQSTRCAYDEKEIPQADLEILKKGVAAEGIQIHFLTREQDKEKLMPLVCGAIDDQLRNPEFKHELIRWMRFSEKEAIQKGDGLWTACSGIPATGRVLGTMAMRYLINPRIESKRWRSLIEKSAGFALFTATENNPDHWIRTGRTFQRFALTATSLGIKHSHVNMPCQVLPARRRLAETFGQKGEIPLLLIRFGYSARMPYAYRRRIHQVLKADSGESPVLTNAIQ